MKQEQSAARQRNGIVKFRVTYSYDLSRDLDLEGGFYKEFTCDSLGRISTELTFANRSSPHRREFYYGKNGKISRRIQFVKNSLLRELKFVYDPLDRLWSETWQVNYQNDTSIYLYDYFHSTNGKPAGRRRLILPDSIFSGWQFRTDPKGRITKEWEWIAKPGELNRYRYIYPIWNDRLIKMKSGKKNYSFSLKRRYRYKKGNLVYENYHENGKLVYERKFHYYFNGLLVDIVERRKDDQGNPFISLTRRTYTLKDGNELSIPDLPEVACYTWN